MNKYLLLLLLFSAPIYAENKPEPNIEIVDIDLVSEQSSIVDKPETVENHPVKVSKTTKKLKLKISVLASLKQFFEGASALIWKLVKK